MPWDMLITVLKIILGILIGLIVVIKLSWMRQDIDRLNTTVQKLKKENHELQVHNGKLYDENQHLKSQMGIPSNFRFGE